MASITASLASDTSFDAPSLETYLRYGEAAKVALAHLERVDHLDMPDLARAALLGLLYVTVRTTIFFSRA